MGRSLLGSSRFSWQLRDRRHLVLWSSLALAVFTFMALGLLAAAASAFAAGAADEAAPVFCCCRFAITN